MKVRMCDLEKYLGRFKMHKNSLIPSELCGVGNVVDEHLQREFWDCGWVIVNIDGEHDVEPMAEGVSRWRKGS